MAQCSCGVTEVDDAGLSAAEVALIVITVIVLVLLALFWFFSGKQMEEMLGKAIQRETPFQCSCHLVSPLVPLKLVQGDLGSVKCILVGWRLGLVTQQWFIKDQQIKLDSQQGGCEDGVSLPLNSPSGYRLKTDPPKIDLFWTVTPVTLQFTPSQADHEGAVCRCRVRHRLTRRSVERIVTLQSIFIRPQISDIEKISDDTNAKVKLQIRADKFHPQDISFTWSVAGEKVTSESAEISDNSNRTFSAVSICPVPLSKVQDPGFKASVVIEHQSVGKLETLATQESLDQLSPPTVSDIQVSEFKGLGQPCTLICSVQDFYPKDITVTWRRVTGDEQRPIRAKTVTPERG
ncbi:uncharacterized protein LOC120536329 [Polypterus senegalus]|uniref:uncharacterized protein LOC120536329 n=1 Tax=Polypterus senegalus TaxID=55291 RepID=UPI00196360EC|nr:uncharacterized protein LOC120536329 [Polypterus senegalus]